MLGLTSTITATDLRVVARCERMAEGAISIHSATANAIVRSDQNNTALRAPITSRSRRNDQAKSHNSAQPATATASSGSGPSNANR